MNMLENIRELQQACEIILK